MPRKTTWFPALVVLVISVNLAAAANPSATQEPLAVVRVVDPELRRLILAGHERSATLRRLAQNVREAGWQVFVQAGRCPEKAVVACLLHFVGAYEGTRYLRVLVAYQGRHPDNVIATLAHELQHAWEVVQEPCVTDANTMRGVFERIGSVSVRSKAGTTYETAAARATGELVLRELGQSERKPAVH